MLTLIIFPLNTCLLLKHCNLCLCVCVCVCVCVCLGLLDLNGQISIFFKMSQAKLLQNLCIIMFKYRYCGHSHALAIHCDNN